MGGLPQQALYSRHRVSHVVRAGSRIIHTLTVAVANPFEDLDSATSHLRPKETSKLSR